MSVEPVPRASDEYEALAELLPDDFSDPSDSIDEIRAKFDVVHGHDPGDDVVVTTDKIGVRVGPVDGADDDRVVLLVHGGGFVTSTASSYAFYGANVVRHCGQRVVIPDYRLAPETVFPGALDDLVEAYLLLLDGGGDPARVVVMGDSCGGGMALALILRLRGEGFPLPAGLVSLCGWFDLGATGRSATAPIGRDPLLDAEWLRLRGRDYVGADGDPSDPLASPIHADLTGCPPLLLHAGQVDRCRSDGERIAANAARDDVVAKLEIWPAMPHGFHGLVGAIPEAARAFEQVRAFIDEVTDTP